MNGERMSETTLAALRLALGDSAVSGRFWSKVVLVPDSGCLWWTGALANRGHGRFWLSTRPPACVIAHRFAWALAYGIDSLRAATVLAHECDNPLCCNVGHLQATDDSGNKNQYARRRHRAAGPLRDMRGPRQRALAARAAIRAGSDLTAVLAAGIAPVEANQLTLNLDTCHNGYGSG